MNSFKRVLYLNKKKTMHRFEELKIWQKAMDITEKCYKASENFPKEEKYGLISQIRKSAVSVPSNIAEGAGRNTNGEFRQFLGIANGSSFELNSFKLFGFKRTCLTSRQELEILVQLKAFLNCIAGLRKEKKTKTGLKMAILQRIEKV